MKLWDGRADRRAARDARRQAERDAKQEAVDKADAAFAPVALRWLDDWVKLGEPDALAAADRWRSKGAFDPQDRQQFTVWGRHYLISVLEESSARMKAEDMSSEDMAALRDSAVKLAKQFDSMRNWMEYHTDTSGTSPKGR